ncbi:hypothetical protein NIES4074_17220 [Cylindrospermum sp. NIES-4074]|nr:hypothetical protein NIES4074_17220 [Cylindrospermum sp. NIES-4074]
MAKISISDLYPTESETYISNLTNIEVLAVFGGDSNNYPQFLYFGFKFLHFVATMYAIDAISFLVSSFNTNDNI